MLFLQIYPLSAAWGRKIPQSVIAALLAVLLAAASAAARDPENCLLCHKYRRLHGLTDNGTLRNYHVDGHLFEESIHRELSCLDCHSDIQKIPHGTVAPVNCAATCHLDRWRVLSGTDFSHRDVAATFNASVHGKKTDDPPEIARLKPGCTYCHTNDLFALAEEIPSAKVLARCSNCHKEESIKEIFTHIAHRFKHKTTRAPHAIVSLCSGCHADPAVQKALGLHQPAARAVATYNETLHARLMKFGATDTAHCLSCHASDSIHDIRPSDDPASSVHPDRRHITCSAEACHPGADSRMARIDSHLDRRHPVLAITENFMQAVTFLTLTFLFSLTGIETYRRIKNHDARFLRWRHKPYPLPQRCTADCTGSIPNLHRYVISNPRGDLPRYSIHIVLNHAVMALTFAVAAATGLPLFFHNAECSHKIIAWLGGISTTRLVHRINAALFSLNCLYHVVVLVLGTARRIYRGTFDLRRTQMPRWKDVCDLYHDLRYFLGFAASRPRMEKFMYRQKLLYFAMIWGVSVLTLSGCCLLFPEIMVRYLPFTQTLFNVLRLMHGEESLLAVLVILLWHLLDVHGTPGRFPVQWTFWNGKISKDHQIEEHFLEYERQVREGVVVGEEEKLSRGDEAGGT